MDAFWASLYSARCLAEVCTFAGCLVEKCKRRLNKRNHLVVSKKMRNFAILYKQFKFRKYAPHALKGQKLLAQGSALGIIAISKAPCKGKSLMFCLEF